jgi:hypothetical protein
MNEIQEKCIVQFQINSFRKNRIVIGQNLDSIFSSIMFLNKKPVSELFSVAAEKDIRRQCAYVGPGEIAFSSTEDIVAFQALAFVSSDTRGTTGDTFMTQMECDIEDNGCGYVFGDSLAKVYELVKKEIEGILSHSDVASVCLPTLWKKEDGRWEMIGVLDMDKLSAT